MLLHESPAVRPMEPRGIRGSRAADLAGPRVPKIATPDPAHLLVRGVHEVAPGEQNLSVGDTPWWVGNQTQDRHRTNGFPGSAFADDRDRLTLRLCRIRHRPRAPPRTGYRRDQ